MPGHDGWARGVTGQPLLCTHQTHPYAAVDQLTPSPESSPSEPHALPREGSIQPPSGASGGPTVNGTVEVKTDVVARRTGNLYIEYQCQYQGEWRPSGILTTTSSVWAFVIGAVVIAAPTLDVREVARLHKDSHGRDLKYGSHPTRGVAIPIPLYIESLNRVATGRYEVAPEFGELLQSNRSTYAREVR